MRRVLMIITASLAVVALVAPGSALAHHSQTPAFRVHTSAVHQGGTLHIQAKELHAVKGSTFSATAVVHFGSGDQTVQLHRRGKSFVATGSVSVSLTEGLGTVPVDVAFDVNGTEDDASGDADVEDNQGDDTQGDDSCQPTTPNCDQGDQNDDDQGEDCSTPTTCTDQGDQNDDQQGDDNNQGDQ